jgi:riboflavin kinase/FMN adenylyltransferase
MQSGKSVENKLKAKSKEHDVCPTSDRHGTVLTFGVFDGVHIAHQIVIKCVVNRARSLGIDGVVISFDPHPALSISGKAPLAITTTAAKTELLKMQGIDRIIVADFNEQFAQLSPQEFVSSVLVSRFQVREVVVGYDCAFGKDRAGDRWLLKELAGRP